jgi:hypothetical protein
MTFSDAARRYIEKLKESGGKGIDRKECQLNLHLKPFFGQKGLANIGSFDVERYKKKAHGAGRFKGHVQP